MDVDVACNVDFGVGDDADDCGENLGGWLDFGLVRDFRDVGDLGPFGVLGRNFPGNIVVDADGLRCAPIFGVTPKLLSADVSVAEVFLLNGLVLDSLTLEGSVTLICFRLDPL